MFVGLCNWFANIKPNQSNTFRNGLAVLSKP